MEILKKISKDKLIIMVTHNPELAQKYSSRIIKILDGVITEDSNPIQEEEFKRKIEENNMRKTSMKFWTAFRLSLNNLLTKKGRTILVSFAGSIGIIGIALVQSVSNGFQSYVDSIQEETLTSYPLTIMEESSDIAGTLLAMRSESSESEKDNTKTIKEEQYISKVLDNLSTNDLKSFKKYLEENYNKVDNDLSSVKYGYSVEPLVYGIDTTQKVAKLSPNDLFNSGMSSSIGSSMMSTYTSIYSQMIDDKETLLNSYDVLAGHFPENYDEMIIVLSEKNSISDLLVYSLGLRDTEELKTIVSKIMKGETVDIRNEPLQFSYEDLMNTELKLIMPADLYKYNSEYNVYEDMTDNEEYMKQLYDNATPLKIVGIVTAKEGVTSTALNPGISYTSDLVDHIIDYASNTDIVKKQLENEEVDVISNSRFDEKNNGMGIDFKDLISIDTNQLQSAFNIRIDENQLQNKTQGYMSEISNAISTDIKPAKEDFMKNLNTFANGVLNNIEGEITTNDIDNIINNYLNGYEPSNIISSLEQKYIIPKDTFKTVYSGLLKGLLQVYISSYDALKDLIPNNNTDTGMQIPIPDNSQNIDIKSTILSQYLETAAIQETGENMARAMTEAVMKKTVLTKIGELTKSLTSSFASAFNVDQDKIANSFKMKMTEEEITRLITAMISDTDSNARNNLINLGYQNKEEPTYISFYFNSFDGKEDFKDFINKYNEDVKEKGDDDKEIKYSDTTGILMGSVKTIVNAVTYVLIAFISISLIVSSIMIGIITYISVYERTKEIGILRSIGASKRNISSIFNAETFIIGLLSGLFGIGVTYILIPIINSILHHFTGNIPLNAAFYLPNAIVLVILSIILTLLGGLIPARAASKKDPVIALRTE